MSFRAALPLALLACVSVACGDDENSGGSAQGGSGGAGAADQGGNGGNSVPSEPMMVSASAPDERTVVAELDGAIDEVPDVLSAYELSSDFGTLPVTNIEFDAEANTITLTTEKQKLGVTYHLTIEHPGSPLDQDSKQFLSADTATFWATDFADFSDFEVVATRLAVGENIVFYGTDSSYVDGTDDALDVFDNQIFPKETAVFNEMGDLDGNGKLVALGLDGHGFYGGYFGPINSLTQEKAEKFGVNSKSMEMLYISVPDLVDGPSGNGWSPEQVLPHEFSHLLYNESHGLFDGDWSWHNEGLAECAVHVVHGVNPSLWFYTHESSMLGDGQSLVIWNYANYSQYIQAYVFWTYVASRLGGVAGYGDLFQLDGDPASIDAFLQAELGQGLAATQLDFLTAAYLQQPTGSYGFDGMIELGGVPQPASSAQVDLLPFTGVFLAAPSNGATPIGAGGSVVHRGVVDSAPDLAAPFDVAGGAVIALNTDPNPDPENPVQQSSGTLGAALTAKPRSSALRGGGSNSELWKHPPPLKPANMDAVLAWRKAAHGF